jgi:hypothetical protein
MNTNPYYFLSQFAMVLVNPCHHPTLLLLQFYLLLFCGLCFDMNPNLIHFHPPSFSPSILFSTSFYQTFISTLFFFTQGYQYGLWFDTHKHFGNFVKFVRNVICRSWFLFQVVINWFLSMFLAIKTWSLMYVQDWFVNFYRLGFGINQHP